VPAYPPRKQSYSHSAKGALRANLSAAQTILLSQRQGRATYQPGATPQEILSHLKQGLKVRPKAAGKSSLNGKSAR